MNTRTTRPQMTITIERTPRTFTVDGNDIQVEELGIRLPFARKPVDLKDMCACVPPATVWSTSPRRGP